MSALACKECGSDPIAHGRVYWSLCVEHVLKPLSKLRMPSFGLSKFRSRIEQAFSLWLFDLFAWLGFARYLEAPDEKTLLLGHVLWEEAGRRGIEMREWRLFGLPRNLFVARFPGGRRMAFEGMPLPNTERGTPWMDDKAELKRRFQKLRFPVARGGAAFVLMQAGSIFDKLEAPVIVKPYRGSASRHTTLHVSTPEELLRAYRVAKEVAPFVVIEEELEGPVYRPTVVGRKLAATLRRDKPAVVGDGRRSIEELIAEENTNPKRQGPYFSRIPITPEVEAELALQELALRSVPEEGRKVILHQKINWSVGGTTADVSEEVHPDNVALFEEVAEVLGAPVVGIDFIIDDISRSWKETERCGIIECNSMPFLDNHHLPFTGQPRNVAAKVWDLIS